MSTPGNEPIREPISEMDKRFDPRTYEAAWQRRWAEAGYFVAAAPSKKPAFCLMIPPPNVTGKLHIGHALQTALQDLLTRWQRMRGKNALWLPGTDHAGIATQLMVERQLAREGTSRRELGRERFLERMWTWKEQYHGNIRQQLDLLGASCDWTRERFTLDEGLSNAVREAFVRLYEEGLIRRGEYLVNWSPVQETAVSDLEVVTKTVQGKLYHIAYPVEGSEERIVVATTRPETMLGDTAVAYHPEDERYQHLAGRAALLPLVGRRLPFVADSGVEKEFGTGLVKVTPFHDPFDFELGRRHGLPGISVIGRTGHMTPEAGPDFAGLERFAARAKVVERLRAEGYLEKVEDHVHNVGHSERGGEPIEPLMSTQWFLDVSGMAGPALAALQDGSLRLVPDSYDRTWEHWLSNIRPWCISRQLWWGHQIPAWYDETGRCFVARSFAEAAQAAGTDRLTQDEDVLDTWFSSGLWPFSTLGWPAETADLATFYPTDVLVTAHDILFFWVARMVMLGVKLTGEVPFAAVHLTGLVRDAAGEKMSKTKGNVLDPSELVAEYGADALRFTLTSLDSPGRDIPLNPDQIAGYRAFGNKIWNAARFCLSRVGEAKVATTVETAGLAAPERWILSRLSQTAGEVGERLEDFRFDEACNRLYHFFWGDLCDWYIELAKPALSGEAPRPRVGEVLLTVLDRSLRLLHPVMPFLTEEVWQRLPGHEAIHPETICLAPYPQREPAWEDGADDAAAGMEVLIQVVTRIRALRSELNLPPKAGIELTLQAADAEVSRFLAGQEPLLAFLCRADRVAMAPPPEGARRELVAGVEIGVSSVSSVESAEGLGAAERERLAKERERLDGEIARAEERLGNEAFVSKAPAQVVLGNRKKLSELKERRERIAASLATLAAGRAAGRDA
ncbi:MAG TPA: valine--tRNA ligase [Thermoanaerobaculia bacterium]|nr:valine--tRNA ligase [Thermoanaerobaculia bacterium]